MRIMWGNLTKMKTIGFLFTYARRYRVQLGLTIFGMLGLVAVQLIAPWIIRQMIALLQAGLDEAAYRRIGILALAALAVYASRAGLTFLRSYMAHVAGWGVVADVRSGVYKHLQKLSLRFYEERQTGQLMSRVVNDSDKIEMLIAHAVPDVAVNVFMFAGVNLVLAVMNVKLMLLCLVPIPLIVLGMHGFARFVTPAFRKRQQLLGELNASLNDNLSGIREIKAFAQEDRIAAKIGDHINKYRASLLNALKLMATFEPFIEFAASLGVIVVIYFGGHLVMGEQLPLSDLVAFFLYLELLYQPVRTLSGAWENIQEAYASVERVAELMEEEPEVASHRGHIDLAPAIRGSLALDNVDFEYIPGVPVLRKITLEMPAGSVTALVGPTGVGKTTLASLIPRFYEVTAGSITLDNVDIRNIRLEQLRSKISIVLQDVFLFHGTARENILFARPGASESELLAASRAANAHEFISELSDGYETILGERGVKLSGGQKQRISIARALLADAPILILDEATSSVDTETEHLIQEALDRLMVGRTTIIIAHRLSTIRKADNIVVMQNGRIAEMGTHEALMSLGGAYRQMNDVYA